MKNIHAILKSYGMEIPSDKKAEFDKAVLDNYKTVSEMDIIKGKLEKAEGERDTYKTKYDADIKQRDEDLADLKKKLEDAGGDAEKMSKLQTDLETLQSTYDTAKKDYESKLTKQAYEFAVKEKVAGLKFSSNSAKKAFIADAIKEEMKIKDGELQGFDDFVENYKKSDADAFLKEKESEPKPAPDNKPKPTFSGKSAGKEDSDPTPAEKPSVTFF